MGFGEHICDDIGRCYCKDHRREKCAECCLSFDLVNRHAEERAGLIKPKTPLELAAEQKATAMYALRGMQNMIPRPNPEVFEQNRQYLRQADAKLSQFSPLEVQEAMKKAIDVAAAEEINRNALMQAMARKNPGKTTLDLGEDDGKETQKIYDEILAKPVGKMTRAEAFTCAYCQKTFAEKLMACGRCQRVSYCSKECQTTAWKAHKKQCIPWDRKNREPKTLELTWEQLETQSTTAGQRITGRTLEVRAVLDESNTRQVFQCKDRVGIMRRVAAYTNNGRIPGLKQGALLRWKNPRFHYFMDGSTGARIEQDDLKYVTIGA